MADNPRQFAGQGTSGSSTQQTIPQGVTTTAQAPISSQDTTFESIQNMTPQSLASLEALIAMLQGGGSLQQKAEIARKKQTQDLIQGMLKQYSTGQAFTDAQGLMALNLQKAMEANRPQIQRAVEGAGTSASSMQGLLAQNLSRDSALAASALGGEQAAKYGSITSSLTGQLANMANTAMDPVGQQLIEALRIASGAVKNTQRTSSGTKSGGGTTVTSGPITSSTGGGSVGNSGGGNADWAGSATPWGVANAGLKEPNIYLGGQGTNYGGMTITDYLRTM